MAEAEDEDAAAEDPLAEAEDADDETVVVTRLDDAVLVRVESKEDSVRMEAKSADSEDRADTTTEDAPASLELASVTALLTAEETLELASKAAALASDGPAEMAEEALAASDEIADSALLTAEETRMGFVMGTGIGIGMNVAPVLKLETIETAEEPSADTTDTAEAEAPLTA